MTLLDGMSRRWRRVRLEMFAFDENSTVAEHAPCNYS